MRVYEVILRSGVRAEIVAETLHEDPEVDDKIYFYRDKSLKGLIAYFRREEVVGIIYGPEKGAVASATRFKSP